MGIFINLDVAYNVSNDEWAPVYEESLFLAKKFKLMDLMSWTCLANSYIVVYL